MHRRLAGALLVLGLAAGCGGFVSASHRGSGVSATAVKTLPDFRRIHGQGVFELRVEAGAAPSVEIEADDNLLPLFESAVLGDELRLGWARSGSYAPVVPIVVRVTLRELTELDLSGAIRADVRGLARGDARIELTGASQASASGTIDRLVAQGSGACGLRAYDLRARSVELRLSGACWAEVQASDGLHVDASGACKVRYRGDPAVESSTSGACSVAPE